MKDIGIYITDASFDHKSKVASVSFIELISKKTNEKHNTFKNVFEAEFQGIKECMIHASRHYNQIIVFCDSKQAIKEAKRELYTNKKWNRKIKDIQLVWLPREFTEQADFLTKNIINPVENKKQKEESFIEDLTRTNVMDIFIKKEDKIRIVKKMINELKSNYDIDIKFHSPTLKKNLLEEDIVSIEPEEMDLVSIDIVSLINKNPSLILQDGLLNQIITMLSFSI